MDQVDVVTILLIVFGIIFLWIATSHILDSYYRAFDILLLTSFIGLLVARLTWIFSNKAFFANLELSIQPFIEDTEGSIHISEKLPWVLFKFWNGLDLSLLFLLPLLAFIVHKSITKLKTSNVNLLQFFVLGLILEILRVLILLLNDKPNENLVISLIWTSLLAVVTFVFLYNKFFKLSPAVFYNIFLISYSSFIILIDYLINKPYYLKTLFIILLLCIILPVQFRNRNNALKKEDHNRQVN